jgi:hypothetical protein
VGLSDTDLITAAEQLHRLESTLAAVKLHLITEIDARDIPAGQQVRGTALWLRSRLLLDAGTARRLVEQAAALRRHPAVDAAVCAGTISLRQADAITDALDALPTTELGVLSAGSTGDPAGTVDVAATSADHDQHGDQVGASTDGAATDGAATDGAATDGAATDGAATDGVEAAGTPQDGGGAAVGAAGAEITAAEIVAAAQAALLEFAAEFAPGPLRRIGGRILDHVAPQVADRLDALALERQERRAFGDRGFTLAPPVSGRVRVSGQLTVEDAAIVSAALDPLSFRGADADQRSPAQRRADALVEVCRLALRTGQLPDSGGEPAQLAVSVPYDPLTRSLGAGRLDSGGSGRPGRGPAAGLRRPAAAGGAGRGRAGAGRRAEPAAGHRAAAPGAGGAGSRLRVPGL